MTPSVQAAPRLKPKTRACLNRLRAAGGAWVSGNDLFQVAGTRYSARIFELRHDHDYTIERRSAPNGSPVDWYRLVEKPRQLTLEDVA